MCFVAPYIFGLFGTIGDRKIPEQSLFFSETKSSRSKDITPAPGPTKAPKRTWYVARCVCVESFECLSCSPCAVFRPFSRRFALGIIGFNVQLMHTCRTVS